MTAIAGLVSGDAVWIGGDSAGISGTSIVVRADQKVFTSGPYVFGFTTSFRMGQLIRYRLDAPPPPDDGDLLGHMCTTFTDALRDCLKQGGWAAKESDRETGGNFLVGVSGHLFEVLSDYQVAERADPFNATGCGEDLLLGSLYSTERLGWSPEKRLLTALEAAERFSTGVCGPFHLASAAGKFYQGGGKADGQHHGGPV